MRYLLILMVAIISYGQTIPSEIPRDRKNSPAAVLMYFDESDSTFHYLRIDSLSADIITELQTLNAKSFATSTNQTTIIGHIDGIETLLTTLNGYVDGLETLLARNSTGGQGTQSVTTSATALPSQSTKVVWLENQNSSGNIYYGFSSGVTTSNGRLLSPMTAVKIETDNLADIYVIAGSSLTIRYSYQN